MWHHCFVNTVNEVHSDVHQEQIYSLCLLLVADISAFVMTSVYVQTDDTVLLISQNVLKLCNLIIIQTIFFCHARSSENWKHCFFYCV